MNNNELVEDFTRLRKADGLTLLEVALVRWPQPHTPTDEWIVFRKWKRPPTREQLAAAQEKALMDRRFFRVCGRCGERNNRGHMHDVTVCQGCAQRELGVEY